MLFLANVRVQIADTNNHAKRGMTNESGGSYTNSGRGHGGGAISGGTTVTTINRTVPIPVPQPYTATITRRVPVPVAQSAAVPVSRPVPVSNISSRSSIPYIMDREGPRSSACSRFSTTTISSNSFSTSTS